MSFLSKNKLKRAIYSISPFRNKIVLIGKKYNKQIEIPLYYKEGQSLSQALKDNGFSLNIKHTSIGSYIESISFGNLSIKDIQFYIKEKGNNRFGFAAKEINDSVILLGPDQTILTKNISHIVISEDTNIKGDCSFNIGFGTKKQFIFTKDVIQPVLSHKLKLSEHKEPIFKEEPIYRLIFRKLNINNKFFLFDPFFSPLIKINKVINNALIISNLSKNKVNFNSKIKLPSNNVLIKSFHNIKPFSSAYKTSKNFAFQTAKKNNIQKEFNILLVEHSSFKELSNPPVFLPPMQLKQTSKSKNKPLKVLNISNKKLIKTSILLQQLFDIKQINIFSYISKFHPKKHLSTNHLTTLKLNFYNYLKAIVSLPKSLHTHIVKLYKFFIKKMKTFSTKLFTLINKSIIKFKKYLFKIKQYVSKLINNFINKIKKYSANFKHSLIKFYNKLKSIIRSNIKNIRKKINTLHLLIKKSSKRLILFLLLLIPSLKPKRIKNKKQILFYASVNFINFIHSLFINLLFFNTLLFTVFGKKRFDW